MTHQLRKMKKTAKRYLCTRGPADPVIPWDRITAVKE